ncbi:MAG: sporulation protein YunB [Oscillospiraceae bacterium]|nr:sporulation protein YunB [Oscillospiraceae bacterium]MCI2192129.1 sporulation protein YunB [Oscillospiraceae bacterium]MCI2206071.1 sporulation protein YunB [Oscillospiraceae bacterium]
MRRWGYRRSRIPWRGLLAIVAVVGIIIVLEFQLKPLMRDLAALEAKRYAAQMVSVAVQKELESSGVSYSDFAVIQRDTNGKVLSISSNVVKMNELKSHLVETVQYTLSDQGNEDLTVPLGTLLGGELFHGRGPGIPLRVTLSGNVTAEFHNIFEDAGVNQTRQQIDLELSAQLYAYLPGVDSTTDFSTDVPVAETVIVGEVPVFMASGK